MAITTPFSGGCACGEIRYECTEQPLFTWYCHCRDCQRASGGPSGAVIWVNAVALTFTKGTPKSYEVVAASGFSSFHRFCENCGSPMGMTADAFPDMRAVSAASLDNPGEFVPVAHLWTCRAHPWGIADSPLPQFQTQPTEVDHPGLIAATRA